MTARRPTRKAPKRRTRNPSPGAMSDDAIQYEVIREASSAPEHYAMAIEHWKNARRAESRDPLLAEFHWRMGDAHKNIAHSLLDVERVTTARKLGYRR